MVRYYFDLQDGDSLVVDDEGTDLLDIAEAQIEAAAMLADMADDLSMRVTLGPAAIAFVKQGGPQRRDTLNRRVKVEWNRADDVSKWAADS